MNDKPEPQKTSIARCTHCGQEMHPTDLMQKHTERHIQIKNGTLYSKTTGMKITGSNTDGFIDTGKLTFNPMLNSPPALSEWKCYLFGNKPGNIGIIYMPTKGQVPNWFVRWMMKICFACTWVKEKK